MSILADATYNVAFQKDGKQREAPPSRGKLVTDLVTKLTAFICVFHKLNVGRINALWRKLNEDAISLLLFLTKVDINENAIPATSTCHTWSADHHCRCPCILISADFQRKEPTPQKTPGKKCYAESTKQGPNSSPESALHILDSKIN